MRTTFTSALMIATVATVAMHWSTSSALAKTPKDTLVVAQDLTDVITIDPAFTYGNTDVEIPNNLYDRLIQVDPKDPSTVSAGVADRWEFSPDGSTITFFLQRGLKFQSGNPITSEDVVFSLRRVVMLDALLSVFPTRLGWTKDNLDEAVKAIDSHTVQLKLYKELSPNLALINIGTVMSAVLDKKLVMEHAKDGDMGRDWLKAHAAGSGPFSLISYKPTEGIVLESNRDYRLGAPALKRVVIRHVLEPSSQRLLLESGDVDIARNLPRDQLDALRKSGKANVQSNPKLEMITLQMNSAHPVLGHPKVQEAMRWLIDYHGMERTFLNGEMKVAQTFWPHGELAIPDVYRMDIAKAKSLLAEAGYPSGFKVTLDVFNTAPWTQIAQSIKATMAEAGIILEIVASDRKVVFSKHRSRMFELVINTNTADYMDPDAFSPFYWSPDDRDEAKLGSQFAWRAHWKIPGISIVAEAARAERNPSQRNRLYKALQYSVQQTSPIIFMFIRNHQTGIADNVREFAPLPTWGGVFYRSVYKE